MRLSVTEKPSDDLGGRMERLAPRHALRIVEAGRMVLVDVQGPLDVEHTPRFEQQVRRFCRPGRKLVVDLRRAEFVDSAGVRTLLSLHQELQASGGELRLVVAAESRVERTLTLLQLQEHFRIYHNASEAWTQRGAESQVAA